MSRHDLSDCNLVAISPSALDAEVGVADEDLEPDDNELYEDEAEDEFGDSNPAAQAAFKKAASVATECTRSLRAYHATKTSDEITQACRRALSESLSHGRQCARSHTLYISHLVDLS